MEKLFNPLSYSKIRPIPLGRPVDDYKALFQKKDEDYNYVVDTTYKAETLLNQMPHNTKDAWVIDNAKNKLSSTLKNWKEKGDLENRVLDVKSLANDLANKSGLATVQRRYQKRQAAIQSAQKAFEDGKISLTDMNRAIADADTKDKGIQFNPKTGTYIGDYSVRPIPENINYAEKFAKAVEGYKANGYILDPSTGEAIHLTNGEGKQIVRTPEGKLETLTGENVTERELARALRSYASNDPNWRDRVTDDLYYETDAILYDADKKERRAMTTKDLDRLSGTYIPTRIMAKYDVKTTNELIDKIESEGLSPETVYKEIRAEQMLDNAISFGVDKESYVKYEPKYMNPVSSDGSGDSTSSQIPSGIVNSVFTTDTTTKESIDTFSNMLTKNDRTAKDLEEKLKVVEHPDQRDEILRQQKELKAYNDIIKSKVYRTMENAEDVNGEIEKTLANEGGESVGILPRLAGAYITSEPLISIRGLDINKGDLMDLAFKSINNDLTDEEIGQYINQDRNKVLLESFDALANKQVTNAAPDHPLRIQQQNMRNNIINKGEIALNEFEPIFKKAILSRADGIFNTAVDRLRNKAEKIGDTYVESAKEGDAYTQNYHSYIQYDMDASGKRKNITYQTQGALNKMKEQFPNDYYTKFSDAFNGQSINKAIEELLSKEDREFKNASSENGRVLWKEATLTPLLDNVANINTGNYNPAIRLTVPITNSKGDKQKDISLTVVNPDESYMSAHMEGLQQQKALLENKRKAGKLSKTDADILLTINKSLYTSSGYAKKLDALDLNNITFEQGKNTLDVPFEFWKDNEVGIKIYKGNSIEGNKFYLTNNKKGEDLRYLARNNKGYFDVVKEEQLAGDEWTSLGGNSVDDLKFTFGTIVGENLVTNPKDFKVNLDELERVTEFAIVGNNVIPELTPVAHNYAKELNNYIPNLEITDGLRPINAGYGAENSTHKDATTLDFRNNPDLRKLANLSKNTLKKFGIAKILADYNDGHIHVEFLNN